MRRRYSLRRAATATQWCVVAALITLAIVASITLVGNRTNTKLNQTATDIADPTSLTARFGSSDNGNANGNANGVLSNGS